MYLCTKQPPRKTHRTSITKEAMIDNVQRHRKSWIGEKSPNVQGTPCSGIFQEHFTDEPPNEQWKFAEDYNKYRQIDDFLPKVVRLNYLKAIRYD